MSTHDARRRSFLLGSAAASVSAAGALALPPHAHAQAPQGASDVSVPARSRGEGLGAFFNASDALTVTALTERIMPGAPGKPGATDAGVLNYIDLALAGAYSDLQEFYRHGLTQLEDHCSATYKASFVGLTPAQQDEVIGALDSGKISFEWPRAVAFFETLRKHTMEGMFADPLYGGNRNFSGWTLVGFPGAQEMFTKKDMDSDGRFTRAPIVGLQS